MFCPVCDKPMLLVEHHAVEVDWCPQCGGCWLDRGELDLLLEQAGAGAAASPELGARSKRKSPITRKTMRAAAFPGIPVELDICPETGGIWFDGGELHAVAKGLGGDRAAEALSAFFGSLLHADADG